MLRRLKNLWRLSGFEDLKKIVDDSVTEVVAGNYDDIVSGKARSGFPSLTVEGDGKAEFLPDMDEDTLLEWQRNEDLGWKNFKLPWQKNRE